MKKILIAIAFIATNLSIYAQEPMGGGDFGGGRPPMGNFNSMDDEDDEPTEVLKFPEIPGLTDKQREKVIKQLVKEHDAVAKLEKEKRALLIKLGVVGPSQRGEGPNAGSGRQPRRSGDSIQGNRPPEPESQNAAGDQSNGQRPEKSQLQGQSKHPVLSNADKKKLEKFDKKIKKVHANADKKYRSVLSQEQYLSFKEKKKEIQFNSSDSEGNKSQKGNRSQGRNRNSGGNPPDMPMGGGGDF
ncbi:MAG: hypothetical protein H6Q14_736 [Bacteroidetes bacterium]|nr:hypothetical protein [Bacteroidota bacterium]